MNNLVQKNDILLESLVELANELGKYEVPLIVGGGLSLYIRTAYINKRRSPRYKERVFQKSTKDIDVFLTSDLIADAGKITIFRDTLNRLGYTVKTKYFQFQKKTKNGDSVLIDLLASPVPEATLPSKEIRLKPPNVEGIHARRNDEAVGINIGLIPVQNISPGLLFSNLFIVSSFNYILLKLHAFKDCLYDIEADNGRHHAYDIFSTVLDMDEQDWINACDHLESEKTRNYITSATEIVGEYFRRNTGFGVIRLKENELYNRNKTEFDTYIPDFLKDLQDMFKI
jgi:hypothetical protein